MVTSEFAEEIRHELNCQTVFTIPGVNIGVKESIVVSWIIIAVVVLLCMLLVRNLSVDKPGKVQLLMESCVEALYNMLGGMVGPHATEYIPFLATVLIYIGIANIIGIFGFKPPTKDLNVTVGLSVMSICLIELAGIRKKGFGGWLKAFTEPIAIITPINILELVIRPLSLCMRLFGNVLGAYIIMELIKMVIPVVIPLALSFYFDLFDGAIQAYVFVFLTCLYIKEAVE